MNILLFSVAIIVIGILLYYFDFGSQAIVPVGFPSSQCNPIFFSGNKCQKNKKHNMLRISKLRKK